MVVGFVGRGVFGGSAGWQISGQLKDLRLDLTLGAGSFPEQLLNPFDRFRGEQTLPRFRVHPSRDISQHDDFILQHENVCHTSLLENKPLCPLRLCGESTFFHAGQPWPWPQGKKKAGPLRKERPRFELGQLRFDALNQKLQDIFTPMSESLSPLPPVPAEPLSSASLVVLVP